MDEFSDGCAIFGTPRISFWRRRRIANLKVDLAAAEAREKAEKDAYFHARHTNPTVLGDLAAKTAALKERLRQMETP